MKILTVFQREYQKRKELPLVVFGKDSESATRNFFNGLSWFPTLWVDEIWSHFYTFLDPVSVEKEGGRQYI